MKHTLLAVVISGLAGSAAVAGSPEPYIEHVYLEPPVVENQWDGIYGGVLGGMQSGEITEGPFEFDAVNYGVFAGYNYQQDNMVIGAEVAAQMGTMDFDNGDSFDIDMLVDAKVRVGYSFGDALVFASGGYSSLGMTSPDNFAATGWNAGAGIDYAISEQFFVGGEYVYRSLPNTEPGGFDYTSHGAQFRAGVKF